MPNPLPSRTRCRRRLWLASRLSLGAVERVVVDLRWRHLLTPAEIAQRLSISEAQAMDYLESYEAKRAAWYAERHHQKNRRRRILDRAIKSPTGNESPAPQIATR